MRPLDFPYVTLRALVQDSMELVDKDLIKKVQGYGRSRNLPLLTSCTSKFIPALHGMHDMKFLRQVEALFKKNSIFSSTETCRETALQNFRKAEQFCGATNFRLEYFYANPSMLCRDISYWISRCEAFIEKVLGDFDVFLNELPQLIRLTSGASSTASRERSLPQLKIKTSIYCTQGAENYLSALFKYFGADRPKFRRVDWNRLLTVPKNWKTDRTIACEPEGNLPLQLAFDTYVKRRLKKVGIDLSDQGVNQRLALKGSRTNSLATLDGEMASDTVSYNTVAWLFPPTWFSFLDRVRTPCYKIGGQGLSIPYQKFSSMGNGSTFCIETLIFAAVCYAVGVPEYSVYGDDIICSRAYADQVIHLLRFLGFKINKDKTFIDGPFRESCGVDAYHGIDITPVYMRYVDGRKATMSHFVNSFLRIASPGGALSSLIQDVVSEFKLPFVPFDGDSCSGVWVLPDVAHEMGRMKYSKEIFGFRYKAFKPKTSERSFRYFRGYYLWFLAKANQVRFSEPFLQVKKILDLDLAEAIREFVEPRVTITSASTIYQHNYVRKWVGYSKPRTVPQHLYWWSEVVEREFPL